MSQHIFDCKNPRCGKPVPLLYPILQGTPEDQFASVVGHFHVVIGCPAAGRDEDGTLRILRSLNFAAPFQALVVNE